MPGKGVFELPQEVKHGPGLGLLELQQENLAPRHSEEAPAWIIRYEAGSRFRDHAYHRGNGRPR